MQRDMDLIRELLLRIEKNPQLDGTHYVAFNRSDDFGEHSFEEVLYHVDLLFEAGFVKGTVTMESPAISRLTWQGHEFIDDISDSGIWASIKERIKGLPEVSIALIGELAKAELRKHLKLP